LQLAAKAPWQFQTPSNAKAPAGGAAAHADVHAAPAWALSAMDWLAHASVAARLHSHVQPLEQLWAKLPSQFQTPSNATPPSGSAAAHAGPQRLPAWALSGTTLVAQASFTFVHWPPTCSVALQKKPGQQSLSTAQNPFSAAH
jgi:hypothetical protein